jgi:hypothetical protein
MATISAAAPCALFTAASFAFQLKDWDSFEPRFMNACLNAPIGDPNAYLNGIDTAVGVDLPKTQNATFVERMCRPLPQLFRLLPHDVILPFFGISTG